MGKKREIRLLGGTTTRAKGGEESRRVEGYAALFNTDSKELGWGFYERINPGAFDSCLKTADTLCLLNHDQRRGLLARYRVGAESSLELRVDDKGLYYAFDAPRTALGDELLEGLRRGDITESSFAFWVEDEAWTRRADGTYLRTILKVGELVDVSPVYDPAYSGTEVSARSRAEVRALLGEDPEDDADDDTEDTPQGVADDSPEDTPDNDTEGRARYFAELRARFN